MKRMIPSKRLLLYWIASTFLVFSLFALGLSYYARWSQFQFLENLSTTIIEHDPKSQTVLLESLKEISQNFSMNGKASFLSSFGYRTSDFFPLPSWIGLAILLCFLLGLLFFFFAWRYQNQKIYRSIEKLRLYLEQVNMGKPGTVLENTEGEIALLQDEIYKTLTMLYQTRDTLHKEKANLADNLANIAHQIKSPITSISLSLQMMKKKQDLSYTKLIERQMERLIYLEESLLLLSRIDAGTLTFHKKKVDLFTLLMLAAENLDMLAVEKKTDIEILNREEIEIYADQEWTMEALMNVLKNGLDHTEPGSTLYCFYENNPLYTQIRIWDQGEGFLEEDLPHLFERFYRGKQTKNTGIGIGLSIAKALIEEQNGTIRAFNLPKGGACFEIRFYSH